MYKVIASGSTGNAVLYHESMLVDCGIPLSLVQPYLYNLQIVLLTHIHHDHFNVRTISALSRLRPSLRFGCCQWLADELQSLGIKNIDVYEIGKEYDYGIFSIVPVKLYHDVPNCGYRIFKNGYKILHATDTAHLEGITAKNYDLYALEHNYDEETVFEVIEDKSSRGEFSYEKGAINSHLSEQQARRFVFENKGVNSQVLRLHETSNT